MTAFDFSDRAIAGARTRHGDAADWRLEDWFATNQGPFDAVFDHTCFVAMEPRRREAYLARTASMLRPGGLWLGVLFHSVVKDQGPPFAISMEDLRILAEPYFELLLLEDATRSHPRRADREFLVIGRILPRSG